MVVPRTSPLAAALLVATLGCGREPAPRSTLPRATTRSAYLASVERDARAIDPLIASPFVHRFAAAARSLPSIEPRRVYRTADAGRWFARREEAPATERAGLVEVLVDDEKYYEADVSTPLDYARPLDIAIANGAALGDGARLVDLGYGSIGHLQLLASVGVQSTGIDVRPALRAYYGDGAPGVRLLHGRFPGEVRPGGGHDLFLSKNTLKKGYIHPDRPAPPGTLFDLGVDDATFLRAVHDTLKPHGFVLVYNLFIPIPPDKPFKPMSDGRSPFPEEAWQAAGFDLVAFDRDDTDAIQRFLEAELPGDPTRRTIRALYTLARRRD